MSSDSIAHTVSATDDGEFDALLDRMADAFAPLRRSPLLHSPADAGLDYEDVTFPAADGVPLEAWLVPAAGSDRLVIVNHPMGFSRSGMPTHLDPWRSAWASSGNDFEVDFIPDLRILHDAGYTVLTYDLRNFGLSAAANGAIGSSGIFESRDVLGSLRYARERPDLARMRVSLFSRCLGANATLYAMRSDPSAFARVRSLVACQPLSTRIISSRQLELNGVPADRIDDLDRRITLRTGIGLDRRDPHEWALHTCVPTFLYQVRDDILTRPEDVETIFDNIPIADKQLRWIEGTTARWDGYMEFQRRPKPMLDWFERHIGDA